MSQEWMSDNEELEIEELELDIEDLNQLTKLGNEAVKLGLISGHGHHRGKYEILIKRESLLMTETEAKEYLKNLLDKKFN